MAEHSHAPAPWRLTWGPAKGDVVVDAGGEPVAAMLNPAKELADADGARIVEAVNCPEAVADIDKIRAVARKMKAKERELWARETKMGNFAMALLLDGWVDRLLEAIGEAPPKGGD